MPEKTEKKAPAFGLKAKFLVYIISAIIVMGGLFSVHHIHESQKILTRELEKKGKALVHNLAYNSKYGVMTKNKEILEQLLAGVLHEEDVISAIIYDTGGKILVKMSKGQQDTPIFKYPEIKRMTFKDGHYISYTQNTTPPLLNIIAPIRTAKMSEKDAGYSSEDELLELGVEYKRLQTLKGVDTIIIGYTQITVSLQELISDREDILQTSFIIILLLTGITVFFSFAFVRHIIRPIKGMTRTATEIARGNLSLRVNKYTQDEMGVLADCFNQMVDSLQTRNTEIQLLNQSLEQKVRDRTKQLEIANLQMRQERDKAQNYLDIADVMLVVLAADQTVSLINRKGCEILGYEPNDNSVNEIVNKNWFDTFIPENNRNEVRNVFNKQIVGKAELVQYYENPILTKDDRERIISWHNTILRNEKGEIIGTLSSGEDITERKHTEEELRKHRLHLEDIVKERTAELTIINEKLKREIAERKRVEEELRETQQGLEIRVEKRTEELKITHEQLLHAEKLSALGKLAASIAHEFNNPIYGIKMVLEQIDERPDLHEKERKSVALAKKECGRVTRLIHNLQDFYRPSSGVGIPLDIHQVIEEVLQICDKKLKLNKIKVVKNFTRNLPRAIGVTDQLKQVFLNMVSNAEEAMIPKGGRLTIQTTVLDNKIQIAFKDNGYGISKENLGKIFDPFFTTKKAVKGTGLGLSVSYGIIRRHKGNISVESTPNKGSTFTIELPIMTVEAAKKLSLYSKPDTV